MYAIELARSPYWKNIGRVLFCLFVFFFVVVVVVVLFLFVFFVAFCFVLFCFFVVVFFSFFLLAKEKKDATNQNVPFQRRPVQLYNKGQLDQDGYHLPTDRAQRFFLRREETKRQVQFGKRGAPEPLKRKIGAKDSGIMERAGGPLSSRRADPAEIVAAHEL